MLGGAIEPLQVYAHILGLLRAYGGLEQVTAKLHRVPSACGCSQSSRRPP
jgi:hypothetical protein